MNSALCVFSVASDKLVERVIRKVICVVAERCCPLPQYGLLYYCVILMYYPLFIGGRTSAMRNMPTE